MIWGVPHFRKPPCIHRSMAKNNLVLEYPSTIGLPICLMIYPNLCCLETSHLAVVTTHWSGDIPSIVCAMAAVVKKNYRSIGMDSQMVRCWAQTKLRGRQKDAHQICNNIYNIHDIYIYFVKCQHLISHNHAWQGNVPHAASTKGCTIPFHPQENNTNPPKGIWLREPSKALRRVGSIPWKP